LHRPICGLYGDPPPTLPQLTRPFAAVSVPVQLGGVVGDAASTRFPNSGRIAVTQFSVGIGVPLSGEGAAVQDASASIPQYSIGG
jgi:hypothetical protein